MHAPPGHIFGRVKQRLICFFLVIVEGRIVMCALNDRDWLNGAGFSSSHFLANLRISFRMTYEFENLISLQFVEWNVLVNNVFQVCCSKFDPNHVLMVQNMSLSIICG